MTSRNHVSSVIGIIISIVLASSFVFSAGCAKKEEKEIKVGAILCITGSGAVYGEDTQRGIQLAVNEINNSGGINGKPIKLIIEDDQTNPTQSASATTKLINQDKVQVIIGAVTSSSMLADAPIAERSKVVMLSPGASNPNITNAGDFIFRNWISDSLEGKAMADYLSRTENIKKVAILYINNDYGVGLKDVFSKQFTANDGEIVSSETYNQDETDFRSQLLKIKRSQAQRVYLPGYYKEMALILKQARELGTSIPFRSVVTFEDPELLKLSANEAEGVIYSSPFYNPDSQDSNVKNFVKAFTETYKRKPGIFAAHGYDAMYLIVEAIRRTKSISSVDIRRGLLTIKNYPGTSGNTTFDNNGDVVKPVAIKIVKNREFHLITTVK